MNRVQIALLRDSPVYRRLYGMLERVEQMRVEECTDDDIVRYVDRLFLTGKGPEAEPPAPAPPLVQAPHPAEEAIHAGACSAVVEDSGQDEVDALWRSFTSTGSVVEEPDVAEPSTSDEPLSEAPPRAAFPEKVLLVMETFPAVVQARSWNDFANCILDLIPEDNFP